jgi:DNA replication protein DnaC
MIPNNDLAARLTNISLKSLANNLDDFIARANQNNWPTRKILDELCNIEINERSHLSLQRRLRCSGIGRFKPITDFDWNWPRKIDRDIISQAFSLDFIREGRNLILLGGNGLGKTMIAKNIAHAAVLAGHSVLFRSAADIIHNLQCDSPMLRRKRLQAYATPHILAIDELAYLSYDDNAADLLYEVVNRRYERRSIIITTNRQFSDWNQVFPNATSITALLDRLTHHADVSLIDGDSYRLHESQIESAQRRKVKK